MSTTKITDDNIYSVNSTKITGEINASCFPAVLPAVSGANLTNLPGAALGFKNISGWADGETQTISLTSNAGGLGKAAIQVWEEIADLNKTNADWDITTNDSGFDLTDSAYAQTLTPAATTGDSIDFTMGGGTFASTDVGKLITNTSSGETGQAQIISIASNVATCNIIIDFTNTDAIASGDWKMFAGEFKDGVFQLSGSPTGIVDGAVTTTSGIGMWYFGNVFQLNDNEIFWAGMDDTDGDAGRCGIFGVSGETLSANPKHNYTSDGAYYVSSDRLSDTRAIIAYADQTGGYHGKVLVVDRNSSSSFSNGSILKFEANYTSNPIMVRAVNANKAILCWNQPGGGTNYLKVCVLTISGSTITKGPEYTLTSPMQGSRGADIQVLTEYKFIVAYCKGGSTPVSVARSIDIAGTGLSVSGAPEHQFYTRSDEIRLQQIGNSGMHQRTVVTFFDNETNVLKACVLTSDGSYTSSGTVSDPFYNVSTDYEGLSYQARGTMATTANQVIVQYGRGRYILDVDGTNVTCTLPVQVSSLFSDYYYMNWHMTNFNTQLLTTGTSGNQEVGIALSTFSTGQFLSNQYVTTISGTDSIDTSNYVDLNSMTVTETLNGGTANFAFSTNSTPSSSTVTGGTFFVIGSGQTTTRDIASSLNSVHGGTEGEWYINNNTTYGSTTWVAAATNETKEAISEATAITANQMSGTTVNAVTDTTWPALGTQLSVAITLYSTDNSSSPTVDGISFNYDGAMINRDRTGQYVIEMPSVSSIKVTAPSSGGPRNARVYINS